MRVPFTSAAAFVLIVSAVGCAGVAETSSPWQYGIGLRTHPELAELDNGTAVHAVIGLQRQWFDGGHDNVFAGGIQGRTDLASGDWLGGEATYNNWRVKQDSDVNPVSHVFGLSALYGHPLPDTGIELWASGGILYFGDFNADGDLIFDGGLGYQFMVGFDLLEIPGLN